MCWCWGRRAIFRTISADLQSLITCDDKMVKLSSVRAHQDDMAVKRRGRGDSRELHIKPSTSCHSHTPTPSTLICTSITHHPAIYRQLEQAAGLGVSSEAGRPIAC